VLKKRVAAPWAVWSGERRGSVLVVDRVTPENGGNHLIDVGDIAENVETVGDAGFTFEIARPV